MRRETRYVLSKVNKTTRPEHQRTRHGDFKVDVAFLEKGGGEKHGAEPGADQQAGQGHDHPQFSIPLFQLRELLADPRQDSFGLSMHPQSLRTSRSSATV